MGSIFTQDNLNNLLRVPSNDYLSKPPEYKYNMFKDKDPFPCIHSALLNSEDIIKYILTTGMIDPFIPVNLQGATYTCTFSGTYLRYNSEGQEDSKTLSNDELLFIEPNSITYLEINERFMVPSYMVIRFNLKVQHVYKGLLLGTGPIVDPGFVGKLYIPLHNLTTNKYCIKKGADLISIEFTKLSIKKDWVEDSFYKQSVIKKLDFSGLPLNIQKKIPPDREVSKYIIQSLQKDDNFYKEPKNELSIGSSIAKYSLKLDTMVKKVNSSLKEASKTRKRTDRSLIIGALALAVAIITLIIPIWQAFSDINKERFEYRNDLNYYQEKVDNLESYITELIVENKKEHLDLLKKEYDSILNKEEPEAIDIYNQITDLEKEILELQKQLQ